MSETADRAYRIGRALAETLLDVGRTQVTDLLALLGQCQAEQQARLRDLTETVLRRAEAESQPDPPRDPELDPADLQTLLDDLRAEIAAVRDRLRRYQESHPRT